ncbi:MAG: 50S ribosomal protein L3 [Deltaproteobacteria bacterium]|nr:50S ribosomal protein L3 [Deltaproteobacteria bacterium]MBW1941822.1 50S ribosomal protein L3 [Deltaproteobacteria bacterium]MBW2205358.1 50S ribosomal protein L3 [Deltaproteobacteria bacterium]
MGKKLYGKKLGMTRYFLDEGGSTPATIIKAGPCVVIQRKTVDKDGYEAIQVGFGLQKEDRINRPIRGHLKAAGERVFRHLREIRVDDASQFELGQEIGVDIFSIGDTVSVTGHSKGRGFAGVIKRWGFSGGNSTHGSRSHRVPGSIGMSATPGRVARGKKMPGRMGNQKTTIKNLKVVDVRPDMGIIALKGAVPGSKNSILEISRA